MAKKVLKGEEEIEFFKYVFGGKEREGENGVVIQSEGVRKAMANYRGQPFVALTGGKSKNVTKKELEERNASQAATLQELIDNIKAGNTDIDVDSITNAGNDTDDVEVEAVNDDIINPGWDLESSEGTLWGAYQTVMYMADHKPVRNYGDDIRLDRALYGAPSGGRDVKGKAHEKALELVAA